MARQSCLSGETPKSPSLFARRCEVTILWKLKGRAGYRRIKIDESSSPATIEDYVEREIHDIDNRAIHWRGRAAEEREVRDIASRMKAANRTPYRYDAVITYDAPNAVNIPARGMASCSQIDFPSDLPRDDGPAIDVEFLQ